MHHQYENPVAHPLQTSMENIMESEIRTHHKVTQRIISPQFGHTKGMNQRSTMSVHL